MLNVATLLLQTLPCCGPELNLHKCLQSLMELPRGFRYLAIKAFGPKTHKRHGMVCEPSFFNHHFSGPAGPASQLARLGVAWAGCSLPHPGQEPAELSIPEMGKDFGCKLGEVEDWGVGLLL